VGVEAWIYFPWSWLMIFRIGLSFGKKFGGLLWLLLNPNLGFVCEFWGFCYDVGLMFGMDWLDS
jgi:hypothetical protein